MKKIIFNLLLSILTVTIFTNTSMASQLPRYLGSERKFRSYIYNPNEVYRYLGHYLFQGFIEFENDESISTITMGDPSQWLFEHLGNRLFLKPVGEDSSQTNMTVITNKKIYHFELTAKEAKGIDDKDLIFVAKFVYPDEKDKNILKFPKAITSDIPDLTNLNIYNFNYQYTGSPAIAPIKVFDNGEFTYFQFARINAEIPAIFGVDSSGFESLVNYRMAGDYIIIEKVGSQFTLRSGDDIVCVYNSSLFSKPIKNPVAKSKGAEVSPRNFQAPRGPIGSVKSPAMGNSPINYPNPTGSNIPADLPNAITPGLQSGPQGFRPPGVL